ncbi:MAG: hypothetical protein K0U37_03720 [Gammaproteobacteria bacterium]|nr:hypothetical protein [Gammaproteobacteria bacterium]
MPLYVVVRQPMFTGFLLGNKSYFPSEFELMKSINKYSEIFVFDNKNKALEMAEIFYSAGVPPKTSGSYGAVAEITMNLEFMPSLQPITRALMYDAWVNTETIKYYKYEEMQRFKNTTDKVQDSEFNVYKVKSEDIASIDSLCFTESAKARNSNLVDAEMTHGFSCAIS